MCVILELLRLVPCGPSGASAPNDEPLGARRNDNGRPARPAGGQPKTAAAGIDTPGRSAGSSAPPGPTRTSAA